MTANSNHRPQILLRMGLKNCLLFRSTTILETRPLIFRANQWTGFYMIGNSAMKELRKYFRRLAQDQSNI